MLLRKSCGYFCGLIKLIITVPEGLRTKRQVGLYGVAVRFISSNRLLGVWNI